MTAGPILVQVRPLLRTFGVLGGLFEGVQTELTAKEDVQQAVLQVIGQREADVAASAEDRVGLAARQQAEDEDMAAGYAVGIRQVKGQIDAKLEALGIDRQKLGDALSAHITVQQNLLAAHIHSADVAAKKKLAEEGARTLLSIGLSVVGGLLESTLFGFRRTQSGLLDAASSAVGSWQDNGKALASDLFDFVRTDLEGGDCGRLDKAQCDADKAAIRAAAGQLQDLKSFLDSLDGLAALCNAVLDPGAEVSVADLPKVALLKSSLGTIGASTSIHIFSEAATLGDVGTDVAQLVALLTSKLEMLTNYYKAKLASQDTAVRGQLFAQEAQRATDLAAGSAAKSAVLAEYYKSHLFEQCFVALRYHIQQVQSFEFMALQKYDLLDTLLTALKAEQKTPQEYKTLLDDAHFALKSEWASILGESNNCGGTCWSTVEFPLAELPGNTMAADGTLTVDIAIPAAVSYSDVTFSDARIYLVGLDTTEDFTIKFVKRGTSKLVDSDAKVWAFTHMPTTPAFLFGYHTDTCDETVHLVAGEKKPDLCDTDSLYMSYSPYGLWDLEVLGHAELSTVTAVRFAFQVRPRNLSRRGRTGADGFWYSTHACISVTSVYAYCVGCSSPWSSSTRPMPTVSPSSRGTAPAPPRSMPTTAAGLAPRPTPSLASRCQCQHHSRSPAAGSAPTQHSWRTSRSATL
jgi:hypothetical protein